MEKMESSKLKLTPQKNNYQMLKLEATLEINYPDQSSDNPLF